MALADSHLLAKKTRKHETGNLPRLTWFFASAFAFLLLPVSLLAVVTLKVGSSGGAVPFPHSNGRQIGQNRAGLWFVAYDGKSSGGRTIFLAVSKSGDPEFAGDFHPPVPLAGGSPENRIAGAEGGASAVSFVLDGDDVLHLIWQGTGPDAIWYSRCDASGTGASGQISDGGNWAPAQRVDDSATDPSDGGPGRRRSGAALDCLQPGIACRGRPFAPPGRRSRVHPPQRTQGVGRDLDGHPVGPGLDPQGPDPSGSLPGAGDGPGPRRHSPHGVFPGRLLAALLSPDPRPGQILRRGPGPDPDPASRPPGAGPASSTTAWSGGENERWWSSRSRSTSFSIAISTAGTGPGSQCTTAGTSFTRPQLARDEHGVAWVFWSNSTRGHTFYSRWLGTRFSAPYESRTLAGDPLLHREATNIHTNELSRRTRPQRLPHGPEADVAGLREPGDDPGRHRPPPAGASSSIAWRSRISKWSRAARFFFWTCWR